MTPDRTATEINVEIDRKHGPTLVTAAMFALAEWYDARKAFLELQTKLDAPARTALDRLARAEDRLYREAAGLRQAAELLKPRWLADMKERNDQ